MKKTHIVAIAVFLSVICVLSAASVTMPDKDFSPNENRYLQQLPQFSFASLLDGTYTAKINDYISDQAAFRDFFTQLKAQAQKLAGVKDINGVYLGSDGYYMEKITADDIDFNRFEKNLGYIIDYSKKTGAQCHTMLVPDSACVNMDKLPANAVIFNSDRLYALAESTLGTNAFIDLRDTFETDSEQLYYRTDHHWTAHGAYLAYKQWCSQTGKTPRTEESFGFYNAAEDFRGSLYSKVLLKGSAYDTVSLPSKLRKMTVTLDGNKAEGCFDEDKLSEKDKYTVFFGGNYGLVNIKTQLNNGRKLLIIKDSFANCFAPLAADCCEEVTMVDLRYYNGDMEKLLDDGDYTEVLFLYGLSAFAKDENLFKL